MRRGRWFAPVALLAFAAAGEPALAAGATYTVVQCAAANRGDEAVMTSPFAYHPSRRCDSSADDNALRIDNVAAAQQGTMGAFTWKAPPYTGIVGVTIGARLRREQGHRSMLVMTDANGRETHRVAIGDQEPTVWRQRTWSGPPQRGFSARLPCMGSGGCPQSNLAKTYVRNVRLTLADLVDPEVSMGGSLLAAGWHRGERGVFAGFSDRGSGLAEATLRVNGVAFRHLPLSCKTTPDGAAATHLVPCLSNIDTGDVTGETAGAPFVDGTNTVRACATDFAGSQTCETHTVRADNTAPALRFTDAQDPEDPELIRALVSDPHSGVASGQIFVRAVDDEGWRPLATQLVGGELRARVDSAAYAAGRYEFKAEATDVAGNRAETALKESGLPMQLTFPLRGGVALDARIEPGGQRQVKLRYGQSRRAVGRLAGRDGRPLAGREVRVEEYFGEGALIDRRIRRVETDARGRWSSRLPAGPSRSVRVYFDGDARYLGGDTRAGAIAVTGRAKFKTSRAKVRQGHPVAFKGRIGRLGARIPNGGKLLELQVRERPRRWQTVREAFRTNPRGRYRLRYRFGRFYQRDVRFRFRVKVAREAGWPYRAATSRARSVTVLAR